MLQIQLYSGKKICYLGGVDLERIYLFAKNQGKNCLQGVGTLEYVLREIS